MNSEQPKNDPVNHPAHYTSDPSGVECITITRHRNFNIGNAIKYLWRAGLKDNAPVTQDLRKAIWYIEDEINRLKDVNIVRSGVREAGNGNVTCDRCGKSVPRLGLCTYTTKNISEFLCHDCYLKFRGPGQVKDKASLTSNGFSCAICNTHVTGNPYKVNNLNVCRPCADVFDKHIDNRCPPTFAPS